jgi:beta-glucosidase
VRSLRYIVLALTHCALLAQGYLNPDLPAEARAADLVARMTLEEKAAQMQNVAPAIPRLNVPQYDWWNEALHGVARAGLATSFPQAIGLAATWDTDLMNRVAVAISTEARAKYNEALRNGDRSRYHGLTFWSPNINIFRDPRWGRGQETYGEDPYLTSRMAVTFITGMQGDDAHYLKTVATPKHFAVHSGPEPIRHTFDAEISEQDLTDTYLPAFRASIAEAKAGSIMCAYNSVDGAPACASSDLLQTRLRDSWGFTGYAVSDCGAIGDIAVGHHYKPTIMEAAAAAVQAGADLSCGTEYSTLAAAVDGGLLPETILDRSLVRLFTARFRLGMFDPPDRVPYSAIPYSENDSPDHRVLALEAARASIVLLKNANGVLPIDPAVRNIAVIGPAADAPDMQLGNYYGTPSRIVTPLEGIRRRFGDTAQVSFALGSTYTSVSPALVPPDVLTTPDDASPGLLAEYFAGGDFAGSPGLSRVDQRVYFNWDMQDPEVVAQIPRDQFAVRWTGFLRAPYAGDYVIGLARPECDDCTGTDSVRLYLDDQMIVGDATPMAWLHSTRGAHVQLDAGSSHKLRIEYRQDHGDKGIELVWIPPAEALLAEAVSVVSASDLAILCVGLNADLESEESALVMPGFFHGDRSDIQLPAPQQRLLRAALDTGKPVVLILMTGSAIAADGADQEAAAILEAWYPGEEGGDAIAQTLAGDNNPSGRLPVTFYQSVDQLPPFESYSMSGRTYRFFTGQPLYGFGYGLSYSTFRYSDLAVIPPTPDNRALRISARVTDDSPRDGDEVVQLYIGAGDPNSALPELKGFQRVHIEAGQDRIVQFAVNADQLVTASSITVSVGGGQPVSGTPFVQTTIPQ